MSSKINVFYPVLNGGPDIYKIIWLYVLEHDYYTIMNYEYLDFL